MFIKSAKLILGKEVWDLKYYINNNIQPSYSGGHYEIHKEICPYYYKHINGNNFLYLGVFYSDIDALNYAKRQYPHVASKIDGCAHCCPSINKG